MHIASRGCAAHGRRGHPILSRNSRHGRPRGQRGLMVSFEDAITRVGPSDAGRRQIEEQGRRVELRLMQLRTGTSLIEADAGL